MKTLFQFLKVFKTLEKNLQVTTSMGIAIIQRCIIFITTKVAVHTTKYLYEVMTIDNRSWFNIHAYLVKGFKCIPILLNLEHLVSGGTSNP